RRGAAVPGPGLRPDGGRLRPRVRDHPGRGRPVEPAVVPAAVRPVAAGPVAAGRPGCGRGRRGPVVTRPGHGWFNSTSTSDGGTPRTSTNAVPSAARFTGSAEPTGWGGAGAPAAPAELATTVSVPPGGLSAASTSTSAPRA